MQVTAVKVNFVRPGMVARTSSVQPRRAMLVRSAPKQAQIDEAVKEAQEACEGDDKGECATAWDTVEELSAAASHAKEQEKKLDPLEQFCEGNPDADECRVYED